MKKIKISELPQSNSIQGLFTIGTDSQNRSVKVPLGEVMDQAIATEAQQRADADAALQADLDKRKPIVLKFKIGTDGNVVNSAKPFNLGLVNPFEVLEVEPFDIATIKQAQVDKTPIILDADVLVGSQLSCIEVRIDVDDALLFFQVDLAYFVGEIIVARKEDPITHEWLYQAHIFTMQSRLADVENSVDADGQPVSGLMSVADKNLLDSLPKKITDETTARTNADTALGKRIDAEQKTREDTDNRLFERIVSADNAIKAETTARTSADKVLTDNLAKEVADRTKAITAEQTAREQADKTLQGNIDALKATATADANGLMSKEDKATLDALPKKITDEATARTNADKTINTDIQGIKDKGSLHDLFLASGATYNDKTKMYQLNGLDLTFEETLKCWRYTANMGQLDTWHALFINTPIRTNFIQNSRTHSWSIYPTMTQAFRTCNLLEVVYLYDFEKYFIYVKSAIGMFDRCPKLREVVGLNMRLAVDIKDIFKKCPSLKTVKIQELTLDISFSDSPLLSKESLIYIISKAMPKSPITITLHPTAYAMAINDADIKAALAKQPNISLAEGQPSE